MIIIKEKEQSDDPNGSGNSYIQILPHKFKIIKTTNEDNIKEKEQRWWP
nr:hypothetical protein [Mycoplasmopsis bovis]